MRPGSPFFAPGRSGERPPLLIKPSEYLHALNLPVSVLLDLLTFHSHIPVEVLQELIQAGPADLLVGLEVWLAFDVEELQLIFTAVFPDSVRQSGISDPAFAVIAKMNGQHKKPLCTISIDICFANGEMLVGKA